MYIFYFFLNILCLLLQINPPYQTNQLNAQTYQPLGHKVYQFIIFFLFIFTLNFVFMQVSSGNMVSILRKPQPQQQIFTLDRVSFFFAILYFNLLLLFYYLFQTSLPKPSTSAARTITVLRSDEKSQEKVSNILMNEKKVMAIKRYFTRKYGLKQLLFFILCITIEIIVLLIIISFSIVLQF